MGNEIVLQVLQGLLVGISLFVIPAYFWPMVRRSWRLCIVLHVVGFVLGFTLLDLTRNADMIFGAAIFVATGVVLYLENRRLYSREK